MRVSGVLLVLSVALCSAQKQKELDHRNEADRTSSRECSNLTLVLDNWKYAIMTQVRDLLLHDHNTVLPDYGRIQPLSDALGDLYKEFNALKVRLAELTEKFEDVEAVVDDLGRKPASRGEPRPGGSLRGGAPAGRRSRVVIRKIYKPTDSQ
uniref:Si:ch73-127m5.3 n=1 Tax=Kryptolebias marmoratus TaxID=37003 RepID=A0A3Q2ZF63_KRYMA